MASLHATGMEGEALFRSKGCPACHGEDGSHPVIADYPVIAGQNAPYLLRQMRDIRDGRRAQVSAPALGERVVVLGQQLLEDGAPVRVGDAP